MSSIPVRSHKELLRRFDGSEGVVKRFETVESSLSSFGFLSVETTGTCAQLTWTRLGNDVRYLVFSQDIYGIHFTKRNRFQLLGLEPGKTYHVFVLALNLGLEYIAFTAFETRPPESLRRVALPPPGFAFDRRHRNQEPALADQARLGSR